MVRHHEAGRFGQLLIEVEGQVFSGCVEPSLGYVISRWIYPPIRRHTKFSISSDVLAKVMVEVALQPIRQEIWENEDMRRHSVAKG